LNNENANLKEQLELLASERSNQADHERARALLQRAVTPRANGGIYAANNATGLKKLVELALALLRESGGGST